MDQREPRWPAVLALLGVGGLYLALPASLTMGPRWLLLAIVAALLIPVAIFHRTGKDRWNEIAAFLVLGIITAWMAMSLALLVKGMAAHTETPTGLLVSAG